MGIKCDVVDIRRSELTTVRRTVPVWETPVLQALWGAGVSLVEQVIVDRKVPDVNDEFARLSARYGPRNSDTPFVAAVYGNFGPGVNALRREIEGAIADSIEKPKAPEVPEADDTGEDNAPSAADGVHAVVSVDDTGEADKVNESDEDDAEDSAGEDDASENDEDDARDLGITS